MLKCKHHPISKKKLDTSSVMGAHTPTDSRNLTQLTWSQLWTRLNKFFSFFLFLNNLVLFLSCYSYYFFVYYFFFSSCFFFSFFWFPGGGGGGGLSVFFFFCCCCCCCCCCSFGSFFFLLLFFFFFSDLFSFLSLLVEAEVEAGGGGEGG